MKILEKAPNPDRLSGTIKNIGQFLDITETPEFHKLINQINEKYYYWDKVKYLPTPEGVNPEQVWMLVKRRRRATPLMLQFGSHRFTLFLNTNIQKLLHFFDLNIGGSLESKGLIPKDEKNRYLISSIMEEAIASSQIEGAVTSRKVAKEMLRKNNPPKNKSEQMIVNNYATIQKILQVKDEELTVERILQIHKLISANTLSGNDEEGTFRKSDDINVVDVMDGTIVYSPPEHGRIDELITDLCTFFNTDDEDVFIHPIIKGCIIHFMIGYIHPFADGNGRTARALFYWYLLKKGYWLTEYLSISKLILKSKAQYARAYQYTEIDENDLTYFIDYKLRTMKLAFEGLREYIQSKLDEKKKLIDLVKLDGISERQAFILKWFYEDASLHLTVREVQSRNGVSNQTARTDLQGLARAAYLKKISLNNKKEAFVKSDRFEELLKSRIKPEQ